MTLVDYMHEDMSEALLEVLCEQATMALLCPRTKRMEVVEYNGVIYAVPIHAA